MNHDIPKLGDVVTDTYTDKLLTIQEIHTQGRDTYVTGLWVDDDKERYQTSSEQPQLRCSQRSQGKRWQTRHVADLV